MSLCADTIISTFTPRFIALRNAFLSFLFRVRYGLIIFMLSLALFIALS